VEIREFRWNEDIIAHISRHSVTPEEVEEVAFEGSPHIRRGKQGRRYLYGKTIGGRYLFVVYVLVGKGKAKVITARDMDYKEKSLYMKRGK
ncbi:MAG TPA: BrnT family toxin, partial [Thermodesulfobacteriota bacterium]|nr:BrnT family toxin [Thermodesulfobacteriota bacterium]